MTTPSLRQMTLSFLLLGCTSFGGPVAHIGYFRTTFVDEKRWIDEATFADWVALCHFLPGPSSSQTGFALGYHWHGLRGGCLAWLAFTLPSVLLLVFAALGLSRFFSEPVTAGALAGLGLAALVVVAHALFLWQRAFCPDGFRRLLALATLAWVLLWSHPLSGILALTLCGLVAYWRAPPTERVTTGSARLNQRLLWALGLWLGGVLLCAALLESDNPWWRWGSVFAQSGALVMGGGHVVLPWLATPLLSEPWLPEDIFWAGYGLAQAVPGPLFTFSAWLGMQQSLLPVAPAVVIAVVMIFLPGLLLVWAVAPAWQVLRQQTTVQQVLAGVQAGVVGLLAATAWQGLSHAPWQSGAAAVLFVIGWGLLVRTRLPAWALVAGFAVAGAVLFSPSGTSVGHASLSERLTVPSQ